MGRPMSRIGIFFIVVLGSGTLAVGLGKDLNYDLLNYHYYDGYAFLQGRLDQDFAPAGLQTYFNPLLDVMTYLGLRFLPGKLHQFLLGSLQGLLFPSVYFLAKEVYRHKDRSERVTREFSFFCAAAALLGANFGGLLGTSFKEILLSIPIVLSLGIIVRALRGVGGKTGRLLCLAGLLTGGAVGLKVTLSLYAFALALTIALVPAEGRGKDRGRLKRIAFFFLGILVGFALIDGFWAYKLWARFDSPFFPLFNRWFRSAYVASSNFRDTRFEARVFWDYLLPPIRAAQGGSRSTRLEEMPFRDLRLMILFLTTVFWTALLLARRVRAGALRTGERIILVFWWFGYFSWAAGAYYYRYFSPLEFLAPMAWLSVAEMLFRPKALRWAAASVLLILLFTTDRPNWGRGPWNQEAFGMAEQLPFSVPSGSMVILDAHPISFVIPYFPEDTRFINPDSLMEVGITAEGDGKIAERARAHPGAKFLLTQNVARAVAFHRYGLQSSPDSCVDFIIKVSGQLDLKFCRLN